MLERAGVSLVGEHVRHIAVGRVATAEISAVGFQREDIDINILSPSKVPVLYRWVSLLGARPGPALAAKRPSRAGAGRFRNSHHITPCHYKSITVPSGCDGNLFAISNMGKNSTVRNFSPENMVNVLH